MTKEPQTTTYTTDDLKANVRTHIPDFDMATEIMRRLSAFEEQARLNRINRKYIEENIE
jgi:hypothetical protein